MSHLFDSLFSSAQHSKKQRLKEKKKQIQADKEKTSIPNPSTLIPSNTKSQKRKRDDISSGSEDELKELQNKKKQKVELPDLNSLLPGPTPRVLKIKRILKKGKKSNDSSGDSDDHKNDEQGSQISDASALEFGSDGDSDDQERLVSTLQDIITTGDLPEDFIDENDNEKSKTEVESKSKSSKGKKSSSNAIKKDDDNQPSLCTVFIGNLNSTVSKSEVLKVIEDIASVDQIRILMQNDSEAKKSRAVAFVDFKSLKDATNVVKTLNGISFQGKNLQVKLANERKGEKKNSGTSKPEQSSSSVLYIRNLSYSTSEGSIRSLFSKFGDIKQIRIPLFEDSGKQRGFCFVEFSSPASAKKALSMDRTTLDGRKILVELSNASSNDE